MLVDHLRAFGRERREPLVHAVLALRLLPAAALSTALASLCGCVCIAGRRRGRRIVAARSAARVAGGRRLLLDVAQALTVGTPRQLAFTLLIGAAAAPSAVLRRI